MAVSGMYIYTLLLYVHIPDITWKILQIRLNGNSRLGTLAMDTLDSSMMKKMAVDSKTKGKNTGSTCDLHN